MDKKSATGVEPSSAAIKATKDGFDTKVNVEKQKDLIANVERSDQSGFEEEEENWSDLEEDVVDEEPIGGVKTLFARNLSIQVERSDIEEFFKEAGQVVDVKFDNSKKYGIFEFATSSQAHKALIFSGRPLLGRQIYLAFLSGVVQRPAQCSSGDMEHGISSLTV